ncbi:hypothetical protein BCEP4_1230010 [Burkholderia cepacia]|nr:hypothetical protein BCEP4_1230010 [Burkholderia cepacia]
METSYRSISGPLAPPSPLSAARIPRATWTRSDSQGAIMDVEVNALIRTGRERFEGQPLFVVYFSCRNAANHSV